MHLTTRSAMAALFVSASLLACERSHPAAPPDTTRPAAPESVETAAPPPPPPAWDASAGTVMLARAGAPTVASVVFPEYSDSTLPDTVHFDPGAVRDATVDLFGRSGEIGTARIARMQPKTWTDEDDCVEWPSAAIEPSVDSARASGWSVAFLHGRAQPVPLDSIESMSRPDSARLAADITRLVSALPGDTSRTFRGIPLSVRTAYRFPAAPGVDGVVADVVRRLNQEANPLEQHTFVVAERDSAAGKPYRVVFHERSAGSEDSLETIDVLAALRLGTPPRTALVLLRQGPDTGAYALLERSDRGEWHIRWTSVHTGC